MSSLTILLENDEVVAVDKPAGLLSHASVDASRPDALRILRDSRADLREAILLHRLDVDTSGVLLFAKNSIVERELAAAFRERTVEKVYWAICPATDAPCPPTWTVDNHLAEATQGRGARPMIAVRSGGWKAVTDFVWRARVRGSDWIEARPQTGRRHQIRAHLAQSGRPIRGDMLYGGPGGARSLLHAHRLSWTLGGVIFTAESPRPADFPTWMDAIEKGLAIR